MLFRDRDNHGVTAEDSMEQTITVTSPFGNTRGDHHVQSDTRRRGTQQITLQAWRPNRADQDSEQQDQPTDRVHSYLCYDR